MKTLEHKFLIAATVAGLLVGGSGCLCPSTSSNQRPTISISRQPGSKLAKSGEEVVFETEVAIRGRENPRYQWFLNSKPLDEVTARELCITGQTGKRLTIKRAGAEHMGLYECVVDHERCDADGPAAITERAELMIYHHSVVTVYGTPIGGGASAGANNCPPKYVGYVNFRKPTAPYGWKLTNPNGTGTASDPISPNTVVRYFGAALSKNGCGANRVTVPSGTDAYRFTIYFTNTVPSGAYSIKLDGFEP